MRKGSRELILKSFEALKAEGGITITGLARSVNLCRSSFYKYYPDIVALIKLHNSGADVQPKKQQELKAHLLRAQLTHQKELVSALTKACSELLVELEDVRRDCADEVRSKDLMINFLEQQLAESKIKRLKSVK
ncbi:hypothetical protein [Pseudomonas coleopterorum]|uniref:hypothetical protein n=1 Tax=Pseudomonas coleopterorum TaxID=1605838 RepID=UPI000B85C51B|nr:hypothetical protein [Pseudomonas coleopterorum]